MKRFYSEMGGNTVWGGGRGPCKNFEGLFMCDDHIEIVECIWVNIWCIFDWIWSQNCRSILPLRTWHPTCEYLISDLLCCCRICFSLLRQLLCTQNKWLYAQSIKSSWFKVYLCNLIEASFTIKLDWSLFCIMCLLDVRFVTANLPFLTNYFLHKSVSLVSRIFVTDLMRT